MPFPPGTAELLITWAGNEWPGNCSCPLDRVLPDTYQSPRTPYLPGETI